MKVFMTGGMGFIGSSIVMTLVKAGHEVTVLARNPDKIPLFKKTEGIRVIKGGMEDLNIIEKNLPGHDACIHNALYWGNSAVEMLQKDTFSSVWLFEKSAGAGVKRLIYTSSTAALGDFRPDMNEEMKSKPNNYYCATKAASEEYLLALSYQHPMRCNIIRPGYTVGNPVVEGAPIENDSRFRDIVKAALAGNDIRLVKQDGTQFIWAGDLARIYLAVLESKVNREIYFGLGSEWVSWERIAQKAIEFTGSKSRIVLEDKGYGKDPYLFDLSKIKKEFGFSFKSWDIITKHLEYLAQVLR